MNLSELNQLEPYQKIYSLIISKCSVYQEQLQKLTLYRKHTASGRLVSIITVYLIDRNNCIHSNAFKLWDDDYLWLITALEQDFPDAEMIDLTAEEDKPTNYRKGANTDEL